MIRCTITFKKTPNWKAYKDRMSAANMRRLINSIGGVIMDETLKQVPVRTGALLRSHRLIIRDKGKSGIIGQITAGRSLSPTNYAPFVAFGTSRQSANPWHERGLKAASPKIRQMYRDVILKRVQK